MKKLKNGAYDEEDVISSREEAIRKQMGYEEVKNGADLDYSSLPTRHVVFGLSPIIEKAWSSRST